MPSNINRTVNMFEHNKRDNVAAFSRAKNRLLSEAKAKHPDAYSLMRRHLFSGFLRKSFREALL
jgi:hypothetical protein